MKPVRLPASATITLPRAGLFALCLLYIVPGLIGRDLWKIEDAAGFGVMWTMAHGTFADWLWPNVAGLSMPQDGPFAYWIGALCIKLLGWLASDMFAARIATVGFFFLGAFSIWQTTYLLGRRAEAQPLPLAFGGQPEASDYGRTLADGALLIYLGCLGLTQHSHSTSASALQISLVACTLYAAARFFEHGGWNKAIQFGLVLGLLVLTGGWMTPAALWLGMLAVAGARKRKTASAQILLGSLPAALLPIAIWVGICAKAQPFGSSPFDTWMAWNNYHLGITSWPSVKYLLKNSIWFAWPAWPFAGWAVYSWRRQRTALHVVLPLFSFVALAASALIDPHPDQSTLLPLLPSLAILAAFELPTMKRGAINAVDWFSVMTLSACAGFIWLGWIAKQTGWPTQLAKNAFKLAPGFKPEFNLIAFMVAAFATGAWIMLVQWRISRRPSVLWRAVVLSSGGVILCWLLLMTLWLPWGNYMQSYASVSRRLGEAIPDKSQCVNAVVGSAQRASFAYFGDIRFARVGDSSCNYFLLQDNNRNQNDASSIQRGANRWELIWEGHRPSDRDERYRLYRKTGTLH